MKPTEFLILLKMIVALEILFIILLLITIVILFCLIKDLDQQLKK
jgi:hypothetical protein